MSSGPISIRWQNAYTTKTFEATPAPAFSKYCEGKSYTLSLEELAASGVTQLQKTDKDVFVKVDKQYSLRGTLPLSETSGVAKVLVCDLNAE